MSQQVTDFRRGLYVGASMMYMELWNRLCYSNKRITDQELPELLEMLSEVENLGEKISTPVNKWW